MEVFSAIRSSMVVRLGNLIDTTFGLLVGEPHPLRVETRAKTGAPNVRDIALCTLGVKEDEPKTGLQKWEMLLHGN